MPTITDVSLDELDDDGPPPPTPNHRVDQVGRIGCAVSILIFFGFFAVIGFYDLIGTATGRFPYVHNSWTRGSIGYLPGALLVEGFVLVATLAWSVRSRRWLPVVLTVACLGIINLGAEFFFHGIPVY